MKVDVADMNELSAKDIDDVSGGAAWLVVAGLVVLAIAAYKAGEHDGYNDTAPSCN